MNITIRVSTVSKGRLFRGLVLVVYDNGTTENLWTTPHFDNEDSAYADAFRALPHVRISRDGRVTLD